MQKRKDRLNLQATFACAFVLLTSSPAYAGWGNRLTRSVLPTLVQRAAASMIAPNANYNSPAPPQVNGYQWSPRPAMDYLPDGDDGQFVATPKSASIIRPGSFLITPITPSVDRAAFPLSNSLPSSAVARSFQQGLAGSCSYEQLVAAKVFESDPLHGSVFKRHDSVKYIILHSTETASPADARRVILSWNNKGLRHPGAQFVVDRDGTICSTTDPDMATVHIDTNKALYGFSNDNSIGIEIVRSGKQQYTASQLDSVTRLVAYLQSHYAVPDANVTTHHHVQPSDRSDPVGFDLVAFETDKTALETFALAHGAHFGYSGQPALSLGRTDRSAPLKSFVDSESVLSTMPKPAPDFRLR